MMFGAAVNLPKCSVRIQTTKRKAKAPVSAAPPNSIDSEGEVEGTSDAQLSLFVTDLGTQIDLSGGGAEVKAQEIHGTKDATEEEGKTLDTSAALGNMMTPLLAYAREEIVASDRPEAQGTKIQDKQDVTGKPPKTLRSVILADFSRLISEIDASTRLQEELIRTEPHLAFASSFLNVVSGRKPMNSTRKEAKILFERSSCADVAAIGVSVGVLAEMPSGLASREEKYAERMRVTRITAVKSLLKEELKKKNPFSASIAIFRKKLYGEESNTESEVDKTVKAGRDAGVTAGEVSRCATLVSEAVVLPLVQGPGVEIEGEVRGENAMMISDDEVMSVGESDEEEDVSDGFSGSGRSTSGGKSIMSRSSRKRPADESPERDTPQTVRRGFPGVITRSEAGCRIHQPTTSGTILTATDTAVAYGRLFTTLPGGGG